MKYTKSLLLAVVVTVTLGADAFPVWAQERVISKVEANVKNYCRLKFPAIREDTLYWDRPVLKDASSGDIIDFYGPCNWDPLGKEEIQRQRANRRVVFPNDSYPSY